MLACVLRSVTCMPACSRLSCLRACFLASSCACAVALCAAFFIMGIVLCLYAIIGVTFYDARSPDDFGNLSRAIISMFRIAAGETW